MGEWETDQGKRGGQIRKSPGQWEPRRLSRTYCTHLEKEWSWAFMAREPSIGPVKRGWSTWRSGKQVKEMGKVIKYCKEIWKKLFISHNLHEALWLLLRISCRNYYFWSNFLPRCIDLLKVLKFPQSENLVVFMEWD